MKTILLVEDEDAIRAPLGELLAESEEEYRVILTSNGREAVNELEAGRTDLVITDLKMPVMDGFALVAHLLRFHPAVPVIVITAYGDAETRRRLQMLGMGDYIEKPADFKRLPGLVRSKLAQRTSGHLVGITLSGLLQLLNLEQKSCQLSVKSGARRGLLACRGGELVHAQVEATVGLAAAYEILGWDEPDIDIEPAPSSWVRTIEAPLLFVLLEAARRKDDAARGDAPVRSASDLRSGGRVGRRS